MGQLERYGLYVLCLVIFLILGVAIWGGDPVQAQPRETNALRGPDEAVAVAPQPEPRDRFFEQVQIDDGNLATASAEPDAGLDLDVVGGDAVLDTAPVGPGAAAPAAAPVPEYRDYKIKRGDSFERIAKRELGSIRHAGLIANLNPKTNPKKLQIGKTLRLPRDASALAKKAETKAARSDAPAKTYVVQDGDNPWTISRKVFKTSKYAAEILKVNNIRDPKRIKVGSTLKMPSPR